MLESSQDNEEIIERIAALDIGKAELVCCVRIPGQGPGGRRRQEVSAHSTMTRSLLAMIDRLRELGVTRVVMESTSDYWKPVFYLLEASGVEAWLVNAKDVKHLPGRPKTDRLDAVWLCKVAERQMIRPSFVPPAPIRELRDLTRYRVDLIATRTAERSRVEKLLDDAQIKLSVVASDIFGTSGRDMMAALIAGQRDPKILAQMARSRLRLKITQLEDAFVGRFSEHHGFLPAKMLARVDAITTDVAEVNQRIEEHVRPFGEAAQRLDEIPGVGPATAHVIIAEVGVDMSRFPTPAHLASWARFAPGVKESADKSKGSGSTGHGNSYLARVLGEAAVAAGKTDTFLGERYRRIARRRGSRRAIVAVGRSILTIVWHLLNDPATRFTDIGTDFYDTRINPERRKRNHIRQLEALGYTVTLAPAAWPTHNQTRPGCAGMLPPAHSRLIFGSALGGHLQERAGRSGRVRARQTLMGAFAQLTGTGTTTRSAASMTGICRSSADRDRRRPSPSARPRVVPANALAAAERAEFLRLLDSAQFVDAAPAQIYAALLDQGVYVGSIATMYRILREHRQVRERRRLARHPARQRPELVAAAPRQVYSWDITKLAGPVKGSYFDAYVMIDIYSRYIVGVRVHARESGPLAASMMREVFDVQGVPHVVHADRGTSMTSKSVADLLEDLTVTRSHSRPKMSNDNPYSEAWFKTLKYAPVFPDRFASLAQARRFMTDFVTWYNNCHRHSGIGLHTPAEVHHGRHHTVRAGRRDTLTTARAAHPERFGTDRLLPKILDLPEQVWINKPGTEPQAA